MTDIRETGSSRSSAGDSSLNGAAAFADGVHEYIREYIALADQKAAFISAIATALTAYFYQKDIPKLFLRPPTAWTWRAILAALALLFLIVSIAAALAVVVPRRKGPRSGFLFWEAIAEHPSGHSYAEQVLAQSRADLICQKLYHCYALAAVCRRKYNFADIAIKCGAIGLLLSALLLVSG